MLKETNHDYQNCLMGNYYSSEMTGEYSSWEEFVKIHYGFKSKNYKDYDDFDDTYHFVFRYDIHKQSENLYELELCVMLQRKGIYTHLFIKNIPQETLEKDVYRWLKGRSEYMKNLWREVL